MERIRYMEHRERTLNDQVPLSPEYAAEKKDVSQFRLICIERIWRLSAMSGGFDGVAAMSAVRLFDRCMNKMSSRSLCKANMLLLAVACFDICFKTIESDFKTPGMFVYYHEGYSCKFLDSYISYETFPQKFSEAEIQVLRVVDGEPTAPTALDYLHECCPNWVANAGNKTGRRAQAAAAAYSYCIESANYSSEEIAAAAAWLALGSGRFIYGVPDGKWPTAELAIMCCAVPLSMRVEISQKMAACMESLFALGRKSMMYHFYRDIYDDWRIYNLNKQS